MSHFDLFSTNYSQSLFSTHLKELWKGPLFCCRALKWEGLEMDRTYFLSLSLCQLCNVVHFPCQPTQTFEKKRLDGGHFKFQRKQAN